MSLSPEFRFWLRPDSRFNGHFFGLYVGGGYYDLKCGATGYQGKFYIAAGISYGFYLPIKSNFGIEFNLGLGFLYTKYEKYTRNEQMDNHYVFGGKDKLKYFGSTKAKISLVWRLGDKAKKGGGK